MTEVVVTTGAIRRAKLQLNRHHQQTNTQLFTGRMPFLLPNQYCQSIGGKHGKLDWSKTYYYFYYVKVMFAHSYSDDSHQRAKCKQCKCIVFSKW